MSENTQFGCACCSPHLKLSVAAGGEEGKKTLLDEIQRSPAPGAPEAVIFHGGRIYPDPTDITLRVEAIGIANHGVIATGTLNDVIVAMEAQNIAYRKQALVGEQTLLPGLIEPHAHMVPSALMGTWYNLSAFEGQYLDYAYSIERITDKLKSAIMDAIAKARAAGAKPTDLVWVCGWGVDPSLMKAWTDITKGTLDDVIKTVMDDATGTDQPPVAVFLLNASGHIGYASTHALEKAGLLASHDDGVLTEQQIAVVTAIVPQPTLGMLTDGLVKVMKAANACGITTLFDAGLGMTLGPIEVLVMRALATTARMTVRVGAALFGNNDNLGLWLSTYRPELDSKAETLFSLRAIKLVADGSNQGLTGLQHVNYRCCDTHTVPGVGPRGLFNFVPALRLSALMQQIAAFGWPMLTHANGDQAVANVLAAYQLALDVVPPPGSTPPDDDDEIPPRSRHRIEHASLLGNGAIEAMARQRISPSFLIGHAGYWGRTFRETILGEDRAMLLDRCKSALDAKLKISLHSDHFVTPLGPLRSMEQAIERRMEAYWEGPGHVIDVEKEGDVLNPAERLTRQQAFRAITIDAAWQCNLEQQVGSLAAGKQADLVILLADPLAAPAGTRLRDIGVLETWVSGRKVYPEPLMQPTPAAATTATA